MQPMVGLMVMKRLNPNQTGHLYPSERSDTHTYTRTLCSLFSNTHTLLSYSLCFPSFYPHLLLLLLSTPLFLFYFLLMALLIEFPPLLSHSLSFFLSCFKLSFSLLI